MSKELAVDYFDRHQSDECHITSDNRVFHTLGAAQSFASGLKDTKVTSYTRAEIEAPVVSDSEDEPQEDNAPKVYTLEDLKAFDATTATYPEIKALANGFNLDSVSQKKDDLLAAIAAYKLVIDTEIKE